jgi:hypothetical protein
MQENTQDQEPSEVFEIFENRPDHHYRTEIPNIAFEVLDPFELAVYAHIKRITGDAGRCWKKAENLATSIGISEKKFKDVLKDLCTPGKFIQGSFLIKTIRFKPNGANDTNLIEVVDIWRLNGDHFRKKKKDSLDKREGIPGTGGRGYHVPGEGIPRTYKEEPSQEEQQNKNRNDGSDEPSVVCSFSPSAFGVLNLKQETKDGIEGLYSPEQIAIAVRRTMDWVDRHSDEAAIRHILKNADTWKDVVKKEQKLASDLEFLKKLEYLDCTQIGAITISVGPNYIAFSGGQFCKQFEVGAKDFQRDVDSQLEKTKKAAERNDQRK